MLALMKYIYLADCDNINNNTVYLGVNWIAIHKKYYMIYSQITNLDRMLDILVAVQ